MKLRIRGDSLRFRLTQGEASKLAGKVKVSESVHFSSSPKDILTYSLEASDSVTQLAALIDNGAISVRVPASMVQSWIDTDQVGIEDTQPISADRKLRISIEKDFQCLERRPEEDETDNFPHP
jgi:hypothetical protein